MDVGVSLHATVSFRKLVAILANFRINSKKQLFSYDVNCDIELFVLKIAIQRGDLDRLMVPTDSMGRKCGVDNGVIDKPYLLFFNLEKCIDARVPLFGCKTPQVCVQQCPTTSFIHNSFQCRDGENFQQIRNQLICQMGVNVAQIQNCQQIEERINRDDCARWYLPSKTCKYFESYSYFLFFIFVPTFLFCVACLHCFLFG